MPSFVLTKDYVLRAFAHLSETKNLELRNKFFADFMVPDVIWTCAGSAHSLAGTRYSIESHAEATFNRLGKKLDGPIEFSVLRAIVDSDRADDGWWSAVETRGKATRTNGEPYENEYAWLLRWNDDGRIVEIRSYFDTMLAEQVLRATG